jgi:hypothetical protein
LLLLRISGPRDFTLDGFFTVPRDSISKLEQEEHEQSRSYPVDDPEKLFPPHDLFPPCAFSHPRFSHEYKCGRYEYAYSERAYEDRTRYDCSVLRSMPIPSATMQVTGQARTGCSCGHRTNEVRGIAPVHGGFLTIFRLVFRQIETWHPPRRARLFENPATTATRHSMRGIRCRSAGRLPDGVAEN